MEPGVAVHLEDPITTYDIPRYFHIRRVTHQSHGPIIPRYLIVPNQNLRSVGKVQAEGEDTVGHVVLKNSGGVIKLSNLPIEGAAADLNIWTAVHVETGILEGAVFDGHGAGPPGAHSSVRVKWI